MSRQGTRVREAFRFGREDGLHVQGASWQEAGSQQCSCIVAERCSGACCGQAQAARQGACGCRR